MAQQAPGAARQAPHQGLFFSRKMGRTMSSKSRLGICLVALLLLACGGSVSDVATPPLYPVPQRQFGVAEADLFDAKRQPNGLVVGPGSGLVTLLLEPLGGPAGPLAGDTATLGVDEMWFDVDNTGSVSLVLSPQNLTLVSSLEISDASARVLALANATQPQAAVSLAHGRYLLRLRAASTSSVMTPVYVWFGGSSPTGNPTDLTSLATGNCVNCNLVGADLTSYNLRAANLTGADLRGALIASVAGGFTLQGTDLLTIYIAGTGAGNATQAGADLSGANLSSARLDGAALGTGARLGTNLSGISITNTYLGRVNLNAANLVAADLSGSVLTQAVLRGANLSGALLRGANLTGADLSGANVAQADLSGATLDGATWVNGHTCAAGSVGICR